MKTINLNNLIFSSALLLSTSVFAQNVGINTSGANPDASAMLDVSATNKGVLIPRVALTASNVATPVSSPTTSLMVYNTATAGAAPNNVTPGYYYWNGTQWVRFATAGSNTNWLLTGNSAATSGTHFLGTTNAQALDFRTNNTIRFRIANGDQVWAMANGTAAAPFYSWSSNTGMGLYRIGTNVLGFSTNALERLRIEANGNVGVNVIPNANSNTLTSLQNGASGAAGYFYKSSAGDWISLEASNASVTQGTGVQGTAFVGVSGSATSASGWAGFFNYDTYLSALYHNGSYFLSDERLKENIRELENATSVISNLRPVIYDKKEGMITYPKQSNVEGYLMDTLTRSEYGFIAQEIEVVLPELVKSKGVNLRSGVIIDLKAVNYEMLIPIIVKVLQEQEVKILELQTIIDELRAILEE